MATVAQREQFRLDLGVANDETVFTNAEVDALYARAEAKHTAGEAADAYALLLGVRRLRAKAVTLADYEQGDSAEKLNQVYKNLEALERSIEARYNATATAALGTMRYARLKGHKARREEWPDA